MIIFKDLFLRDRAALFWILLFPTLMYITMSFVFSGIGKATSMKVAMIAPVYFQHILDEIFQVVKVEDETELKKEVLEGSVDCGIVARGREITVYYTERTSSKVVRDILRSILESIGKLERSIRVKYVRNEEKVRAKDFYVSAGIMMAILGTGFFGAIYNEEYLRRRGIRKLFRVLPAGENFLDLWLFLSHVLAALLSAFLLILVASMIGAKLQISRILLGLAFGIASFIPLGIGLGKIFKKASVLAANLFYFSLMFLSGAFFKAKLALNPAKTLVEILHGSANFLEILLWVCVSILIYYIGRRFQRSEIL